MFFDILESEMSKTIKIPFEEYNKEARIIINVMYAGRVLMK